MASYQKLGLLSLFLTSLSSCFASNTGRSAPGSSPCSAIAAILGGKVFFPGDSGYDASDQSYFFAEARLSPVCIVAPTSAADVAKTIQVLGNQLGGSSPVFAIRGGGLLPNIGAANVNEGVTIDLRSLNSTTVDGSRTIASVGAGALWGNVYKTLDAMNLGAVGARIATAGVGGYFVGGKLLIKSLLELFTH